MTEITHEALEALSKKATQGVWEIAAYYTGAGPDEKCHGLVEVEDFPIGIIDEEGATAESLSPNLEFIVALVNAYRTGQLIHAVPSVTRKFNLGDRVTKTKGSSWTGLVVGFYSTNLTPIGYAVESENEPGSVQIYPESALEACLKARENGDG